ncbi:MAG: PaaI family thioesterase [Candidatus Dormibacteraceae bacterium]
MSDDFTAQVNEKPEGWLQVMGVRFTHATKDEVRCELVVGPDHLQSYGIVNGGVHCGLIESCASVGAYLFAQQRGQHVVGLENSTSFIRAVRAGTTLHVVATPVTRGRQTKVWEGRVFDEQDRIVATGRVRLLCLEPEQALAGERVKGVLSPDRK